MLNTMQTSPGGQIDTYKVDQYMTTLIFRLPAFFVANFGSFADLVMDRRTYKWMDGQTDGQRDGRTDIRMDRCYQRDARTHLKTALLYMAYIKRHFFVSDPLRFPAFCHP